MMGVIFEIDHIIPRSAGGRTQLDNLCWGKKTDRWMLCLRPAAGFSLKDRGKALRVFALLTDILQSIRRRSDIGGGYHFF
jgi:hypothetical protein